MMTKLKLTSLLFLIPFLVQSQLITTAIFTVQYDQEKEQPVWVEYTVQCPKGDASRLGMDFYTEKDIHTSDNDDYKNNIYDKGHLAPAASFNCDKETLKKTFTYLNSALQHEGLNRGVWKDLEQAERNLAIFFEVKVKVEVEFSDKKVPGGATIPSRFIKTLTFEGKKYVFNFPNQDTKGTRWVDYLVE
jgi:DNA/RNA endonuclease G (NUC1)